MILFARLITVIIAFIDFMLASLIVLISTDSKSKNELVGWLALMIVFVLNMILLWI